MFNNISWQGYWITLALIATGYYLLIYLLYFPNDVKVIWNRMSFRRKNFQRFSDSETIQKRFSSGPQGSLFQETTDFKMPPKESSEYAVYACVDELTAYFEETKRSKCDKEELIHSLRSIFAKYPTIRDSEFKESMTNVVVAQCEDMCSIRLSADDVVRVWIGQ